MNCGNTIIHNYVNVADSRQYVSAVNVAAIGTSTVCIAALKYLVYWSELHVYC
jgi:hypothetical protein